MYILINFNEQWVEEKLFLISLFIFTFLSLLSVSFFYIDIIGTLYNIIVALCLLLLLFKELIHHKFAIKESFFFLISCVLFGIMYRASKISIAGYIPFIFSARNVNFRSVLKTSAISSSLGLAFVIFSSFLNLIPNYIILNRQYLGFRYALFAPAIMFNITAIVAYLYKDKIKWSMLFGLIVSNCLLFIATQSKLSFYISIFLITISIFVKVFKIRSLPNNFLCFLSYSYMFFFLLSVISTIRYSFNNFWMYKINQMLEFRLSLANASYQDFGIKLFGSDVNWNGSGLDVYGRSQASQYMYVDNFYMNILQLYGIIFTIILIVLLSVTLFRSYKRKDFMLSIILFIFAFHGLVDDLMFTSYYNAFFLAIGPYIFKTVKTSKPYESGYVAGGYKFRNWAE